MPPFEIGDGELVPLRRVQGGPELYESEVEDLLRQNLDAFVGRPLFPIARQAKIGGGLVPDVLALDDRGTCPRHRGQARRRSPPAGPMPRVRRLDSQHQPRRDRRTLPRRHRSVFAEWTEFTDTASPRLIRRPPELVLVARDLDVRTDAALSFLTDNALPVTILRVTIYEDHDRRRFVDVAADHEVELTSSALTDTEASTPVGGRTRRATFEIEGRCVQVSDLLDGRLLTPGEKLTWYRPRVGVTYTAEITDAGSVRLIDGRAFSSPSRAAAEAAGGGSHDGWNAWRTPSGDLLGDLRTQLLTSIEAPPAEDPDALGSAAE